MALSGRVGEALVVILFMVASSALGSKRTITLDLGAPAAAGVWTVSNGDESISVAAAVPGGIYTDLHRAGIIGEPYYGFNDRETKWVGRDQWTFRRTFFVEEGFLASQNVVLIFDGLDTVATVSVNGVVVGTSDDMFIRYIYPVKDVLKEGENDLEVRFESPIQWAADQAAAHVDAYGYEVFPNCPPPEYQGECHANMIRKMQASFSWNWGPAFPSVGIWKPVRLESYSGAVIRDVKFTATPEDPNGLENSDWLVELSVYLQAAAEVGQNGFLSWSSDELSLQGSHTTVENVEPDEDLEFVVTTSFAVPASSGVKLWWPNGYGKQNLYSLTVSYEDLASGDVSDSASIRVGFRTVRLVQEEIPDARGLTFEFEVNGIRMFTKGSNWIPADVLPERVTGDLVRDRLESVALANQNMMRVWGGGIYEMDEFYQAADELGILIWQDFMFACAMYPVTPGFLDSVRREVRTQVRRLQHHASVAIWFGNNENEVALRYNWYGTDADYDLYKGDYVTLYADVVRRETEEEGFVADNPYSWEYGDVHFYNENAPTWSWKTYPRARYISEYGFRSWPSFDSLAASFPPEELKWDSELMNHRQHYYDGQAVLMSQVQRYMVPPSDVNSPEGFKFFLYQVQVHQSVAVKTASEFARRAMSSIQDWAYGRTMGALYWQTNEIWPGSSRSSLEYGGKWKMLHYFSKKFFAPLLVSPYVTDENEIDVFVVSDLLDGANGLQLEASLIDLVTGDVIRQDVVQVDAPAQYAGSVWKQPVIKWMNGTERENIQRVYYFRLTDDLGVPVADPNFAFLGDFIASVPAARVEIASVTGTAPEFDVEISSDLPALFVFLETEILGYFSDNGFLFFPGLTNGTVKFHSKDASITAEQLMDALTITTLPDNPDLWE